MKNTTAVFIAACVGMCFFGISMIALGAVLPALGAKFDLSPAQTTGIVTLLPAGIMAGSIVFGPIIDRFGHKMLLIASCILVLCGVLGLAFADNAAWLRWAAFAIGLGGGILNGETNALVAEIYDGNLRQARLSLLGVFYGLGALTIPLLLNWLAELYTFEQILTGIAAVMLAGIIYCITVGFPSPKQPQGLPLRDMARVITSPVLLLLGFVLFFQSGIESVTNNWTTTYLISAGAGEATALQSLTAMLIGLTAARLIQSWMFSYVSPVRVMTVSLFLTALGFAGLYAFTAPAGIYASMAIVGAGLASTFPVIFGILGERFAALSGTAMSVALFIALCGQTAMNFGIGRASATEGGLSAFPLAMIAAIAAMLILFYIYKSKNNPKKSKKQLC